MNSKALKQMHKTILVWFVVLVLVAFAVPLTYADTESASPLSNVNAGKTETSIGSLMADALKNAMGSDIAFVAASETKPLDKPIPAGKVKAGDITALVSFQEDPVVSLQVKGSTVRAALERSVSIHPQPNLGFLQVAGVKFTYDASKPAGSRVVAVLVGSGVLLDDSDYTVAVSNSMANGAMGYWKVWQGSKIVKGPSDMNLVKAIETFLAGRAKIDYSVLDRITPAQ
jgi:2',3'-cyclic-nucleotide 2'-phosphodiesterase (5'-nucleotidase family)